MVKVATRWLVLVKIYGNKPKKLFITINKKRARKLNVLPLKEDGPKRVLNSECRRVRMFLTINLTRLGTAHITGIIIIKMVILLSQLEEEFIEEAGSKTEKRFVIIFIKHWSQSLSEHLKP